MDGMASVSLDSGGAAASSGGPAPSGMLEVSVGDPVKQGEGMNTYITYKVTTLTNIRTFANTHFSVIRRFNDFVWVHDRLGREYPGVIVPPLPDKSMMGRFTEEFVRQRQRQLEKFVNRIASHEELKASEAFKVFLEATEDELAAVKAKLAEKKQHRGFMEWLSDTVGGLSAPVETSKDADDIAFEEISSYLDGLEPQLVNVQKHVATLVKKRKDMASALFEFGLSFTLLGQDEKDALGNALARLGKTSDTLSVYATKHADAESMYFEDPIKDYIRLVASVKAALGQRTETRGALRAALTELENKRLAVTRLRGSGKDRQLIEAEAEVKKAEEEVEAAKTTHETVNDRVLTELERFKREKLADIKNVVLDYVQIQIDYNKKLEEAWNALIPELEKVALASQAADMTTEIGGRTDDGAASGAGAGAAAVGSGGAS